MMRARCYDVIILQHRYAQESTRQKKTKVLDKINIWADKSRD